MSMKLNPQFSTGHRFTGATSYHGLKVNVISSGVQKHIRRSQLDRTLCYAKEWLLMMDWKDEKGNPMRQSICAITNMRNRIGMVIPCEDIVASLEPARVIVVYELLWKKWPSDVDINKCWYLLKQALVLLHDNDQSTVARCRVPSYLKAAYYNDNYVGSVNQVKQLINKDLLVPIECSDKIAPFWKELMSCLIKNGGTGTAKEWREIEEKQLTLVSLLIVSTDVKRLIKNFLSTMWSCFFSNRKRSESFVFIVHSFLILMNCKKVDWIQQLTLYNQSKSSPFISAAEIQTSKEELNIFRALSSLPPNEEYIEDIHTSANKTGKTKVDFALVGSFVEKEDTRLLVPEHKALYLELKIKEVEGKKRKLSSEEDDSDQDKDENFNKTKNKPAIKKLKAKSTSSAAAAAASLDFDMSNKWLKLKKDCRVITKEVEKAVMYPSNGPIVGQLVTSSWKQMTILQSDCVLKGPFDSEKGSTKKRLIKVFQRYVELNQNGVRVAHMRLLNVEHTTIFWLEMEQLSPVLITSWKVDSTPTLMVNGHSGRVVNRSSMGIVLASTFLGSDWTRHPELCLEAFWILLNRCLMGIGDSGLWNMLIVENKKVVCIDYEEDRAEKVVENVNEWWFALSPRRLSEDVIQSWTKILSLGINNPTIQSIELRKRVLSLPTTYSSSIYYPVVKTLFSL